jgi:hypothetical protein
MNWLFHRRDAEKFIVNGCWVTGGWLGSANIGSTDEDANRLLFDRCQPSLSAYGMCKELIAFVEIFYIRQLRCCVTN